MDCPAACLGQLLWAPSISDKPVAKGSHSPHTVPCVSHRDTQYRMLHSRQLVSSHLRSQGVGLHMESLQTTLPKQETGEGLIPSSTPQPVVVTLHCQLGRI